MTPAYLTNRSVWARLRAALAIYVAGMSLDSLMSRALTVPRVACVYRAGHTGPRAKTTAAHIQRRARKARAVVREKARQRGRR